MKFNRGAIEIGVNTIIILIIAIVLLGGGVMLVNSIFKKANELPGKIELPDLSRQPSGAEPLVIDVTEGIAVKSGGQTKMKVGIYNAGNTGYTGKDFFGLKFDGCNPTAPADAKAGAAYPLVTMLSSKISQGQSGAYEVIIAGNYVKSSYGTYEKLPAGTYICNLAVYRYSTAQKAQEDISGKVDGTADRKGPAANIQVTVEVEA